MSKLARPLLIALLLLATAACGKKGPPLLPYARIPEAAEITSTRRLGSDVYVTVTVPATDIDKEKPASLQRIEVYGATALTPPPKARFLEIAALVDTIPVARAADPGDTSGTVVPDPKTGALQGAAVIVRDSLSADEIVPRELPAVETRRPSGAPALPAAAPVPQALRRFYMTVPFSHRGRSGPPSAIVELPLGTVPDKVAAVHAVLSGSRITLEWEPSGGLLGWLMERSLPPEIGPVEEPALPASTAKPAPTSDLPPGPTRYNVYREVAADPLALPDANAVRTAWVIPAPGPLNAEPLAELTFSDEVPLDERERCYQIRAVRGMAAQSVESEGSDRICVLAVDIEPPMPVTGLAAIAGEGVIDVSWEPNGEQDLVGYIVLRRDSGSDTLLPLTPKPLTDTRFTDKTVMPGRMYTYVVQAVDNRIPLPNISVPSEVTETAR